jgi:hypothetical protein
VAGAVLEAPPPLEREEVAELEGDAELEVSDDEDFWVPQFAF